MQPRMFALVDAKNELNVYAYGIDTGEEAFTFRREPSDRRTYFSVADNVEAAFELANRITGRLVTLRLIRYDTPVELAEVVQRPALAPAYPDRTLEKNRT
ncbi:MAG: hypothetical protein ACREP9_21950 [Candidatus Dormibacteraceae bacterium]